MYEMPAIPPPHRTSVSMSATLIFFDGKKKCFVEFQKKNLFECPHKTITSQRSPAKRLRTSASTSTKRSSCSTTATGPQSFDLNTDIGQTGKSYSIQQFCFDFVRGNQGKRRARHSKNKAKC